MNENPESIEEGNNNYDINNVQPESGEVKKKNRTLQYYKFLFYSLKTEIKAQDFLKLLRNSNAIEISVWFISLLLYANTPKDFPRLNQGEKHSSSYKNSFIWLHLLHLFRGVLGIFLALTFPRSYQVTDYLETISDSKLETTLFNDLIRETIFFSVTEKIKSKKIPIIIYIGLTCINFVIDIIDFFVIIASLSGARSDAKVVLLTYFIIAGIYITVDLAYIFWSYQLVYIFPRTYLKPIDSMFSGCIDYAMKRFKLGKPKTNVVSEAKAQQGNGPYVKSSNDMKNGGVNVLENIIGDTFGREVYVQQDGQQNKINNRPKFPQGNNYPNSEDQMNNNNEHKLDDE